MSLPRKPCHNCRRRRLRCDRSLPQCNKCTNTGQECLGYQALLTWNRGVASRGKMTGVTFEDVKQQQGKQEFPRPKVLFSTCTTPDLDFASDSSSSECSQISESPSPLDSSNLFLQAKFESCYEVDTKIRLGRHLTDPFFQDLNQDARFYISHFNRAVCKDLVIYDLPGQNPFRDLIPLAKQHPVLLNIIIANSALNLSNASQRVAVGSFTLSPQSSEFKRPIPQLQISLSGQSSTWYRDALISKQRALRLLASVINDVEAAGIDVALGSVLLFTEFELADFGTKDWRQHIHGARALINSVKEPYNLQYSNMSSLRRRLISNCLVYDTLSSTLARSSPSDPPQCSPTFVRSSLQHAEANNYLSFPSPLLETVLIAAQFSRTVQDNNHQKSIPRYQQRQLLSLLHAAQSFDVQEWASDLQHVSPRYDLEVRVHIAFAHRAAVCIYMSRILLLLSPTTEIPEDLGVWVSDIINHLSFVSSESELFKATSWPAFVAGAEARELGQQAWAMGWLLQLWECLPCTMGYVRSAMEILGEIWSQRDTAVCAGVDSLDWIQDLKMSEIDLMIA